MDQRSKINYWIELSDYDLDTSVAMLLSKRYLYVGFMCHQAIEKILKALYVDHKNENPPFTHNLSNLAERSGILNELNEKQLLFLDGIEPLNIETRYPDHKEKIFQFLTNERCQKLIMETQEFQQWIKMKLLKK